MQMTSSKPYLFKAILEWIEDNGLTPHIVVDPSVRDTVVPMEYVKQGKITLNISAESIELYRLDKEALHFSARFNGIAQEIYIPIIAILGVFARENGQGMFFEMEDSVEEIELESLREKSDKSANKSDSGLPISGLKDEKRDRSHLKVIK